ncbi:MAG: right-handed parallel beta-helix repeat-containing protein [Planctomycetota bacterium]
MKPLTTAALLSLLIACPAFAANLKVPRDYPTIQAAVDAAGPGDVVVVSEGVYAENVVVDTKQDLTVRARGSDQVIIDPGGSGRGIAVARSARIELQRLRVRNASSQGGIEVSASDNVRITRCVVSDTERVAIELLDSPGSRIDRCTIENPGGTGIELDTDDCVVSDCSIRGSAYSGIRVFGNGNSIEGNVIELAARYGVSLGMTGHTCTDSLIRSNRIVAPAWSGIQCDALSARCTIIENIIDRPGGCGINLDDGSENHILEANTIVRPDDYGVHTVCSGAIFARNKIKRAGVSGVRMAASASGCMLIGNRVNRSGEDGFKVYSSGNLFIQNRTRRSSLRGLFDSAAPGANIYLDNSFDDGVGG